MFGRYEYHSDPENSHKFWEIKQLPNGQAEVHWGRVGTRGQSQIVTESEALKRAGEKSAKGYNLVSRSASAPLSKARERPEPRPKTTADKPAPKLSKKEKEAVEFDLDTILSSL